MKYRKRVEVVDAEQFSGSNQQAMVDFVPEYLEIKDGNLYQARNPYPLVATEWVVKYYDTTCERMTDDIFQLTWQPGGP